MNANEGLKKNNAIYARVSSREQSEMEQIPKVKETFNIDDCLIYREEVSAWNIDKDHKRLEFLKLKKDIKEKRISNLYIFDIDRLFRNRKRTKEFFEYCKFYKVDIYSVNQKWLNDFQKLKSEIPENFRFLIDNIYNLLLDVYAQTAEDESNKKSERVKLKVTKDNNGVTISTSGKKWGRKSLPKQAKNKIVSLHKEGMSIRKIAEVVQTTDKNNNMKNVSVGAVHKIIMDFKAKNK